MGCRSGLLSLVVLTACVADDLPEPAEQPPGVELPPQILTPAPSPAGDERSAPPAASSCQRHDEPPILPAGKTAGTRPPEELAPADHVVLVPAPAAAFAAGCGADTDGDGWLDGPCNERRKLIVDSITAHTTQEFFHDELYVIADDVRHPNAAGLSDAWLIGDGGGVVRPGAVIAVRTRPGGAGSLAPVRVEGWEDDLDPTGQWLTDDHVFTTSVDLGAHADGATFTRRFVTSDGDWSVTFRVAVERFADPTPADAKGDADGDGITDAAEARVARAFGGVTDPERKDVLVELDWMAGHALRTEAKRQVATQYHRHGLHLFLHRDEELPVDPCLTVPETRAMYDAHFGQKATQAFRYAVMTETIWNDASGVNWGDILLVDDSTWWINGWILPQAGTLIHELGHTLGLVKGLYDRIDGIHWLSYDSAMNYTYQAIKVDYSSDGDGGSDFNDWAHVDAAKGLKFTFGKVQSADVGVCK